MRRAISAHGSPFSLRLRRLPTVESSEFFTREVLAERDFSVWRYREAFGLPEEADR